MKLDLTPGQAQALLRLIRGTFEPGRDGWAIEAIASDLELEGVTIEDEDEDEDEDPDLKPSRACLDIPGDPAGGRIIPDVVAWIAEQNLAPAVRAQAYAIIGQGGTYRSPNGAWSLTPLKD